MIKVKEFIKSEIVLILAFILAVISTFFLIPNEKYFEYIDFRTLGLLFCLMAVMSGINSMGVFKFIAEKMLSNLSKRLEGLNITFKFEDSVTKQLAKNGFDPVYGARPLRREIQNKIEDALSEKLLDGSIKNGDTVVCKFSEDFEFVTE